MKRFASLPAMLFLWPAVAAGLAPSSGEAPEFGWFGLWPLYYRDAERTGWVGPLVESWDNGEERGIAVRPFYSRFERPEEDKSGHDVVFPLAGKRRNDDRARSQLLQIASRTDEPRAAALEHRTTLFPIYFSRSSPDPRRSYTAIFPVAGRLLDRLGSDEIEFALFPLYLRVLRRAVTTTHLLFPFISWTRGPEVHGNKFWPIFGERRWGESRSGFVFWPFVSWDNTPTSRRFALLPLFARSAKPGDTYTALLWPFFHRRVRRNPPYREIGVPWPIAVFGRGAERFVARAWPLFGVHVDGDRRTRYFVWPLVRQSEGPDRRVFRLLFVLASDRQSGWDDPEGPRRTSTIWPLLIWEREPRGKVSWQAPAPLASLVPGSPGIRRNLTPLFRLFHYDRAPERGTRFDMLWRLVQIHNSETRSEWSLAGSLVQRARTSTPDGTRVRWRLLFGLIDTGRVRYRAPTRAGAKTHEP